MNHLFETINQSLIKLSRPMDAGVICCSGGPDSIFLVHALKNISDHKHKIIYFNHQLRDSEIQTEIDIVNRVGKACDYDVFVIPLTITEKNQESYRHARLSELSKFCKDKKITTVYLGHHLNDHIETFFNQLLKGATTDLKGISLETTFDDYRLVHPLLDLEKSEIIEWCAKEKQDYSIDSSNLTTNYTRNKIRALLPELLAIQNTSSKQLTNSISHIQQYHTVNPSTDWFKSVTQSIGDTRFLLKEQLLSQASFPGDALKSYLEFACNDYINKERLSIINRGLTNTTQVTLELESYTIEFDYKWIAISKKIKSIKENKIELQNNATLNHELGTFCVTTLDKSYDSSVSRLAINLDTLSNLFITTIDQSTLKLANQKRCLRDHNISPLQQRFWPIFIADNSTLWTPNAYSTASSGQTVITFSSHLSEKF